MGPEWIVVIAARLLMPIAILRWPLLGGVVAFVADALDVVLLDRLGVGDYGRYNEIDKALDTYYLALEAWTCLAWTSRLARNTALGLFAYRLVGVVLYELTANRTLLFVFPNQFEAFFLAYLVYRRVAPGGAAISVGGLVRLNVGLLAIKELQEYVLHVAQVPVYAYVRDYLLLPLHVVGGVSDPWPAAGEALGAWGQTARDATAEHQGALRAAVAHGHWLGRPGRVSHRVVPVCGYADLARRGDVPRARSELVAGRSALLSSGKVGGDCASEAAVRTPRRTAAPACARWRTPCRRPGSGRRPAGRA